MKRIFFATGFFLAGAACALLVNSYIQPTLAQIPGGGVVVSGTVTPNNCVKWLNAYTIADAGTTC